MYILKREKIETVHLLILKNIFIILYPPVKLLLIIIKAMVNDLAIECLMTKAKDPRFESHCCMVFKFNVAFTKKRMIHMVNKSA